ncbi:MAG TPA: transposase [Candidatus Saccharimonadales bacterium]|nr:transposase [Candidatus Saccharimonadales bacterium]
MPSRNVLKLDAPESFYHVYARGNSKGKIFALPADYAYFVALLQRYLSAEEVHDPYGVSYPNFYNKVELISYCLMPNHFHLLLYQHQAGAMASLMRSLLTSYSRYFNKQYHRSGSLFETRYKASLIADDAYLQHITRYIHLNPRQWRSYEHSSLQYFLQQSSETWIRPKRILSMFNSSDEYLRFAEDYTSHKQMLDILKHELANDIEA